MFRRYYLTIFKQLPPIQYNTIQYNTYNNKKGHNKHTYVAVGLARIILIHHNVRNKQRTKYFVNIKFRSNNFSLWTSVTLISAHTEASASKSGVLLARLALKLCVTWIFEVTKVQSKIVYEEQSFEAEPRPPETSHVFGIHPKG
jgi:hypothetical protein